MPHLKRWQVLIGAVMIGIVLAGCTDLAGDVEIVATVPPATASNAQADLPVELPPAAPDIANGQQIYAQNCTSCHGISGAGDGELVESGEVPRMGSFLDPAHMRQQSPEFYYDIITNGNLVNLMPPWQESLSLQERWDVAMYAYTLHYSAEQIAAGAELVEDPSNGIKLASDADLAAASDLTGDDAFAAVAYERLQSVSNWGMTAAEVTAIPEITLENADFSGMLIQGSPSASLPTDVRIQLQYGDFRETAEVIDGTVNDDGTFAFNDVPVLSGSTYFAVAYYDGRPFVSEPVLTRDLQESNTVDITLYETTNAPDTVTMTGMELVFDYLTVPDVGTGIVTNQINFYENETDFVYHLAPEGQDVRVSLLVSLPIGAVILNDQSQQNIIPVQEEYAVIDTRPVYPGTHTVTTSYFLPYETDAQTIDIQVNNAFSGEVTLIMGEANLEIVSDTFAFVEEANFGSEESPLMGKVYRGTVDLQPGESVVFDIEGDANENRSTDDDPSVLTQDELVPLLIGVVVVIVVLGAGVIFYLRVSGNSRQNEIDRLLAEIAQLEDLHDAGRINHDAFQQKRADLKARLAELMAESTSE